MPRAAPLYLRLHLLWFIVDSPTPVGYWRLTNDLTPRSFMSFVSRKGRDRLVGSRFRLFGSLLRLFGSCFPLVGSRFRRFGSHCKRRVNEYG